MSVLSRTLVWPYRPIHLPSVHFSRLDMLIPSSNVAILPLVARTLEMSLVEVAGVSPIRDPPHLRPRNNKIINPPLTPGAFAGTLVIVPADAAVMLCDSIVMLLLCQEMGER